MQETGFFRQFLEKTALKIKRFTNQEYAATAELWSAAFFLQKLKKLGCVYN